MDISQMLDMQRTLQKKYEGKWAPVCPESAPQHILWGVGEMGEVIDVVKKFGAEGVMRDPVVRRHLIEETGDVLMYLMDMLLCYNISAEEFSEIYEAKFRHNMGRDYVAEHEKWRAQEAQKQQ